MEAGSLPSVCVVAAAAMLFLGACETVEGKPDKVAVPASAAQDVAQFPLVEVADNVQSHTDSLEPDAVGTPTAVARVAEEVRGQVDTGTGSAADPKRPGSDDKWHCAGQSVGGRDISYAAYGEGRQVVLVLASIHGNEPAGTPLTEALIEHLETGPDWLLGRRVLVLPRANPDGLLGRRRLNARGVDLNRNFPSDNWDSKGRHGLEPLCEPESRAIADLILKEKVTRIISIHQPVNLLDYDGPAEALAEAMGAAGPLRVQRLGARPGSLGSWAGLDLGIPIVTVELPGRAGNLPPRELWETYGPMLIAGLSH